MSHNSLLLIWLSIPFSIALCLLSTLFYLLRTTRRASPTAAPYQELEEVPFSSHPNKHQLSKIPETIGILGAGVSGLLTCKTLLEQGYSVEVLEKNSDIGGV